LDQIGAVAGKQYSGDGLAVTPSSDGARLRCVFQRLNARVTPQGLWLISTKDGAKGEPFRVVATAVGRGAMNPLPSSGKVEVAGQVARFIRPGLTEEYSVSLDGVRQDFVVAQKPAGDGELTVQLAVAGARMEQTAYGAQLVLEQSGRKIAYSRLHVTDAKGKELSGRIEVMAAGSSRCDGRTAQRAVPTNPTLAILVNDAGTVYPVRIDPTFSDANWISLGGLDGTDGTVYTAVMDGWGNLYIVAPLQLWAMLSPMALPNGTGAIGRRWGRA
jgi:hypothetical protein